MNVGLHPSVKADFLTAHSSEKNECEGDCANIELESLTAAEPKDQHTAICLLVLAIYRRI
jgi:hypothetical protein